MPFYGFKLNPKQQVEAKASSLFGRDKKIKVEGTRCHESGKYVVCCTVDDLVIAAATHCNWRRAYKLLVTEVEVSYKGTLGCVGSDCVAALA